MRWHKFRREELTSTDIGRAALVSLLAMAASIVVSRFVVARLFPSLDVALDPDRYAELAGNIRSGLGMVYSNSPMPATDRGPGYPAFLALIFFAARNSSLLSVQLVQAFLHGLTVFIVYQVGHRVAGARKGLIACGIVAVFPSLLWYTSRIWAETLLAFLMASLMLAIVLFMERPNIERAIPIGLITGMMLLTKSVLMFFPFLLAVVWYLEWKEVGFGFAAFVILIAALIILPWTVRNYVVLKRILPVHSTMGINLYEGNVLTENFGSAPLASKPHWLLGAAKADTIAPGWLDPMTSYDKDRVLIQASLSEMAHRPGFIARRIAVNLASFFYLGETPLKSLGFLLLQVPLAILAYAGMTGGWSDPRVRAIGWLFLYYVAVHAAVYGTARFAAPIIPVMVVLAFAYLGRNTREAMPEDESSR